MFSIQRNKDAFDRQFYRTDMQSMKEFLEESNNYDDRIALLEEWIIRKEEEYKSRVVLPMPQFKKSDSDLNKIIDKDLKEARERLVAQMADKG